MFDEGRISERARLDANSLSSCSVKLFEAIELFRAYRSIEAHPHGLRDWRILPAINSKPAGNAAHRCAASRPKTLEGLRAFHGGLCFGEFNPASQLQIQG
jgi:hypothetical protein